MDWWVEKTKVIPNSTQLKLQLKLKLKLQLILAIEELGAEESTNRLEIANQSISK